MGSFFDFDDIFRGNRFKEEQERKQKESNKELFSSLFDRVISYINSNYKVCKLSIPELNKLVIEDDGLKYKENSLEFKVILDNTSSHPKFDVYIKYGETKLSYNVSGGGYTSFKDFIINHIYEYMKSTDFKNKGKSKYDDYDYYSKKSYYKTSEFSDLNVDDFFDDDFFDQYFKQKFGEGGGYNRNRQQTVPPNSNSTLSNAFQLMKLSKEDNELTIKKKYRELSMKWHPDRWSTNSNEHQSIANRNFVKLNNAYELIKKYKNIK